MSQVQETKVTVHHLSDSTNLQDVAPINVTNTEDGIVIQIGENVKDQEEETVCIDDVLSEEEEEEEEEEETGMEEGEGEGEAQTAEDAPSTKVNTSPHFDSRKWCDDCGETIHGLRCKIHGDMTHIRDRAIPCRAKLTAPHVVAVRTIEYHPGGQNKMGVFARKVIQKRTEFGPYEGLPQATWKYGQTGETDRLMLKIFQANGSSSIIDCTDENMCNWMMYIRPAKTFEEQNLVAYQHKGAIYYATIKPIPPNVELRVWYSKLYTKAMGFSLLTSSTENGAGTSTDLQEYSNDYENSLSNDEAEDEEEEGDYEGDSDYRISEVRSLKVSTRPVRSSRRSVHDGGTDVDKSCTLCDKAFSSLAELHAHSCADYDEDEVVKHVTPKVRNKRKGYPSKLVIEDGDKDAPQQPKRRGRPPKYLWGEGGTKPSVKPKLRGRAKNALASGLKSKRRAMKVRVPRTLHQCEVCSKAFINESKLKMHMFSHSGEKPFRCSYDNCNKAFTTKFKVMRHELIHMPEKQHACMYCHKNFSRKDHLKHHLRVHDPNKAMHQCSECGKMYASSYSYRTHLAHHAAERGDLTCQVCKEDFTATDMLMTHLKAHAGARSIKDSTEKRQKCPYCEKKFFTYKDVKRHMIVHTKDRNHLCQFCPQKFGRRDHLIRHQKKAHIINPTTGEVSNLVNVKVLKPRIVSPKTELGTVLVQQAPTIEQQPTAELEQQSAIIQQEQQIQVSVPQPQQQQLQQQQQQVVQQVESLDQPRLMDSAMISKLLQSVARGILDPNITDEDGNQQQQLVQQQVVQQQSQQQQSQQQQVQQQSQQVQQQVQQLIAQQPPKVVLEGMLMQQRKRKRSAQIATSQSELSNPASAQGIITSMGTLPAQYLHYQNTTPATATATTNQQVISLTSAGLNIQSAVSRADSITNIAQQLAEPAMSGHFVPPFVSQTQVEQPTTTPQIQVQEIQTVPSQALLQQQQQQQVILQQPEQQQEQQQQIQQVQQIQQPQQQTIPLQANILNANQTVLMGNLQQGILTETGMRLPVLNSSLLTAAGVTGDQLNLIRPGARPLQMVATAHLPAPPGQTKQMLVVTPIQAPNTSVSGGSGTVSTQSMTQYTDSIKLLLSQLNMQQRAQVQGQQPPQQLP